MKLFASEEAILPVNFLVWAGGWTEQILALGWVHSDDIYIYVFSFLRKKIIHSKS